MARALRIQFEGALYHVMSRGDRREDVFIHDADRRSFLSVLGDACERTGWLVHAFVLMPNHFHLVVETPCANLVVGMKWMLGTYTGRFNRRHSLTGHLFAGRYKALLVEPGQDGYFRAVCHYVHLNPARAGLLAAEAPLRTFPWSSWPAYLSNPDKRPAWLRVDRLLAAMEIPKDVPSGRRVLEQLVEQRRREVDEGGYADIRRGWCLGSEAFRRELLSKPDVRVGREHFGDVRREDDAALADRIVQRELRRLGWTPATLKARPKGDLHKLRVAQLLRKRTMLSMRHIADLLHAGSVSYLYHRLHRTGVDNSKN